MLPRFLSRVSRHGVARRGLTLAATGITGFIVTQYAYPHIASMSPSRSIAECQALSSSPSSPSFAPAPLRSDVPSLSQLSLSEIAELYSRAPNAPFDKDDASIELVFTSKESMDSPTTAFRQRMERLIRGAQDRIINNIESLEGKKGCFKRDRTIRGDGSGGGIAAVFQDGEIFQKAGVNISISKVPMTPDRINRLLSRFSHIELEQMKRENNSTFPFDKCEMFTASISLVIHPLSPKVPTVHANYRYFEFIMPNNKILWWFGGGSDLTPTYVNDDDAKHFHRTIKNACDRYDRSFYGRFKKWCDDYFFIKHRNERRGVGGIFFDDLNYTNFITNYKPSPSSSSSSSSSSSPSSSPSTGSEKSRLEVRDSLVDFVSLAADSFSPSYFPLVVKHMREPFTENEYRWQQLRRGRYVEFNLVYDRGTQHGLDMPPQMARPDAVLMSLPLTARFEYGVKPEKGSPEEATLAVLTNPKDWAS